MAELDSIVSQSIRTLEGGQRVAAMELLLLRFASQSTKDVVTALFRRDWRGVLHCYQTGKPLGSKELGQFVCALGMFKGKCVAVAVFRHVKPPNKRVPGWTELLLLAHGEATGTRRARRAITYLRRTGCVQVSKVNLPTWPRKAIKKFCALWAGLRSE